LETNQKQKEKGGGGEERYAIENYPILCRERKVRSKEGRVGKEGPRKGK
jgi:hypothetical protein